MASGSGVGMKSLLFIDHSYHKKTRATQFLQELLAHRFNIDLLWDDSWNGAPPPDAELINARKPDAVLFFQLLPPVTTLRRISCPNLTWVCMRDGPNYRSRRLRPLRGSPLKILNFSRETHDYFSARGQASLHVQYWPAPTRCAVRPQRQRPRLFFWPRLGDISWATLKILLGTFRPESIVLRYAGDPGQTLQIPGSEDIREYNITLLHGWLERDAYLAQLRDCDIFMAPRPLEGIGQALLEALDHGQAVIAPDAPTMNEYVRNGHNGWLYDLGNPQPLDFSRWAEFGRAAAADLEQGHARWLQQVGSIVEFVEQPPLEHARWSGWLMRVLGR